MDTPAGPSGNRRQVGTAAGIPAGGRTCHREDEGRPLMILLPHRLRMAIEGRRGRSPQQARIVRADGCSRRGYFCIPHCCRSSPPLHVKSRFGRGDFEALRDDPANIRFEKMRETRCRRQRKIAGTVVVDEHGKPSSVLGIKQGASDDATRHCDVIIGPSRPGAGGAGRPGPILTLFIIKQFSKVIE